MTFSIYLSIFNIEKHAFPWRESLDSAVAFAGNEGEVVIAVNQSEDKTLDIIREYVATRPNVKVIETKFAYDDVTFDGAIKNAALQACTKEVCIQLDADEVLPLSQRKKWEIAAQQLLRTTIDCYLIPSIDLYGDRDHISNKNVGTKFRLHKKGLKRGVWARAWQIPGKQFDISMSDSSELLNREDQLVRCQGLVPEFCLQPSFAHMLDDYIYTVHLGYLSLEHRANINKAVWGPHWSLRAGREAGVETDVEKLAKQATIRHNLKL